MNISQPLNLKDVLFKVLKNKLKNPDYITLLLAYNWTDICGESLAKKTKPKAIKNKTLIINVANPALSFELNFLKKDLLQRINKYIADLNETDDGISLPHRIDNIKFSNIEIGTKED